MWPAATRRQRGSTQQVGVGRGAAASYFVVRASRGPAAAGRVPARAVIVCAPAGRGRDAGGPARRGQPGRAGGRASPRGWGLRRPRPAARRRGMAGRDGTAGAWLGRPTGRSPALQTLGGGAGPR